MRKWIWIGLILTLTIATAAQAQQIDLKALDKFASVAKEVTQVNLDESMLKAATGALDEKKSDEASAKKAVSNLKGVYVRAFEFDKKGAYKLEDLKPIKDQLKGPDWVVFFQTRGEGEETEIWIHKTKGEADGICLLAAEDDELVVINAIGIGRPEDLSKLRGLGIPQINIGK